MKCIVTGGGGFVGKALCLRLVELGHEVYSISRKRYPELEAAKVACVQADLADEENRFAAVMEGAETVFHTAAKVEMWGRREDFYRVNAAATLRLLEACKRYGVRRFIYTSSPSVVADGSNLRGINEDYPYPARHAAFYPETKAIAERAVCAANSTSLWTIALRPHLIWGPGDTHLVPTILRRAQAGRLPMVGDGGNLTDVTFIEDCVNAHLCAMNALAANPSCRGQALFISQGEPVNMWGWIAEILQRNGIAPLNRAIPKAAAMMLAACCETWTRFFPRREPLLTRFLVSEMTTDHYFDISRAKNTIGYVPQYSVQAALNRTFPGHGS